MSVRILEGDCRVVLPTVPEGSVQCVVTSPPYWGLRDYGVAGQLGLEPTPEAYVAGMVDVFREVRRVLRDDGTLWLNMGDSYAAGGGFAPDAPSNIARANGQRAGAFHGERRETSLARVTGGRTAPVGLKPKDLAGIPWRLAFALQADGWYLRADIIWAKPNPMPESVTDRPTKAHEYVFLLTKSARYYYNADAVREPGVTPYQHVAIRERNVGGRTDGYTTIRTGGGLGCDPAGRNLRSVWTINTESFPDAHSATFPTALAARCILAGSRMGDTVLDPFGGSGTVGAVAEQHGRHSILIELSPAYVRMAEERTAQLGLFAQG